MKLSEFITPELILVLDSVDSWDSLILQILDRLEREKLLSLPKKSIFEALEERESLSSTVFENGLAIPHAKIGGPTELVAGLAFLKEPFKMKGKKEIRLAVVIITAKQTADLYLSSLAAISTFMAQERIEERLNLVSTPLHLYQEIVDSGLELDAILRAKHIMNNDFQTCSPEDSLDSVLETFVKFDLTYCPVVDKNNLFLGEIRLRDVLGLAIPDYARRLGGLKFLLNFEPFNNLSELRRSLKVEDIMKDAVYTAEPKTPVVELTFNLAAGNLRNIPILEEKKLVGFVGLKDLLHKVVLEY